MRRLAKWIGWTLGGIVLVALVAAVGIFVVGSGKLAQRYPPPPAAIVPGTGDVARGEHVAQTHGCAFCHGPGLGGRVFLDIPPGRIVAPNLTPGQGGVGAAYDEVDFDNAVRAGLRPDGQWLLPFMPYRTYHALDDRDAAALAAYLDALPPIDNDPGATTLRPIGYAMVAFSNFSDAPAELGGRDAAVARAATAEHGHYLATTICSECHGATLRGGKHPAPDAPLGPDLTHAGLWPLEDFARVVRSGRVGTRKLSHWMPSETQLVHLDDTEVAALHAYLRSPARAAAP